MKKTIRIVLSFWMTAVLLFSTVLPGFAAVETSATYTPYLKNKVFGEVETTDNDLVYYPEFYDHGYIPKVRTVQNADGSYSICVDEGSQLRIFEVDKARNFKTGFTVSMELESYACFAKGKTNGNYYVLFAKNQATSKDDVMLRLVEYNAVGKRLRSLDMKAARYAYIDGVWTELAFYGVMMLGYGNNDMVADDNLITGYVGRQMFPDTNGIEHQASYAFAVQTESFKEIAYTDATQVPFASHSFQEYIVPDGDGYVYIDRCDNDPVRSFTLTKMTGKSWVKTTDEKKAHSFTFKGEKSYQFGQWIYSNETYSQYGGLIPFEDRYMLVGTYQNNEAVLVRSSANLFVQFFDKDTLIPLAEPTYLTDWSDINGQTPCYRTIVNPQAVKIDAHRVAVLYMLYNNTFRKYQLRLMIVDDRGVVLSDEAVETVADRSYVIPRFGKVFYNSDKKAVEWFTVQKEENGTNHLVERYVEIESSPSFTAPQSIAVSETAVNLPIDTVKPLNLTFTPENAGNYVTFESGNESIVKVDPMGVMTGIGNGTTTITATTRSGMTQTITVSVTGGVPVSSIEVKFELPNGMLNDAEETMRVQKGDRYGVSVNVTPANASNHTFSIMTDRPDVISVAEDGSYWEAVGGGTASITIASTSNPEIRRVYHVSVYVPGEVHGSDIYHVGDLVTFGSYPQTKVTDPTLLAALDREAAGVEWSSYGYGAASDGTGTSSDCMLYKDVVLDGAKYRAVLCNAFRPTSAGGAVPAAEQSYQYQNGYNTDQVYYFKYEPLIWRVLDPDAGYMVCTQAIDSQAYRDYDDATAPTGDPSDWAGSSLRGWLNSANTGFYYTAFTDQEQTQIVASAAAGSTDGDSVTLLTDQDIVRYGFDPVASKADSARVIRATDYAACQGVTVPSATETGSGVRWWLNAPKQATRVGIVSADGSCGADYSVQLNNIGVVPALRIETAGVAVDRLDMTVSADVKTVYEIGEELDLSGIGLSAFYSNCSGKNVSLDDCSILNWNSSVAGEKSVIIKYYGQAVTLKVTVQKSLSSLEITEPNKLTYLVGEPLNLAGMSVRAKYTDGSSLALYSSNYTVSPFDSSTPGEKEITIRYQQLSASFTVMVRAVTQMIVTPPDKLEYCYGQPLDLTGLSVRVEYSDGTSAVLDNSVFTISTLDSTVPGEKTITVSYAGASTTFKIRVKAIEKLLITPPVKTEYFVGQALDLSGLTVKAKYDDGQEVTLQAAEYTVSSFNPSQPGSQTMTVSYGGVSGTFTLTVKPIVLQSIRITAVPQKKIYTAGESLDTTGLTLEATYTNGTKKTIKNGFTASADLRSVGRKTVTVQYTENGVTKSATYAVTVELASNTEIKILGYVKSRSVDYKATVTFHYEAKNVYEGSTVHWYLDGKDKGTSDTLRVEKATASYTVQIKLIASDGKTILKTSEIEQVNVKTGLFAKIGAFFKGLFGMLQKIDQK